MPKKMRKKKKKIPDPKRNYSRDDNTRVMDGHVTNVQWYLFLVISCRPPQAKPPHSLIYWTKRVQGSLSPHPSPLTMKNENLKLTLACLSVCVQKIWTKKITPYVNIKRKIPYSDELCAKLKLWYYVLICVCLGQKRLVGVTNTEVWVK